MELNAENKSIVFSEVELNVYGNSTTFLAAGIPGQYDIEDLDGFLEFVEEFEESEDIAVSVRSYCFGNGQSDHASDDELEYIKAHREEIDEKYGIDCIQAENFSIFHEPINEYED